MTDVFLSQTTNLRLERIAVALERIATILEQQIKVTPPQSG